MESNRANLRNISAFRDLTDAQLAWVLECGRERSVQRGDILIAHGTPADSVFIVVSGRFEVSISRLEDPLAEIAAGEPIGEIAFFAGGLRTATITASRDSVVLEFDRPAFDKIVKAGHGIYEAIVRALARRLAKSTAGIAEVKRAIPVRTVAMVAGGRGGISPAFVESLRRVLVNVEGARLLTSSDASKAALQDWLAEYESRTRLLLMIADPALSEWTRQIVRHADELMIVVEGAPAEEVNPIEQFAFGIVPPRRRRLVRLHDVRAGRTAGTAEWATGREVGMIHHVALKDDEDVKSLCRFLLGIARGLVAAGGGARGPAHVGVYKAFCERGYVFDIFGGTSVGAAVTSQCAALVDADAIEAIIDDIFVKRRSFKRFTFPRYALLDHSNFDSALRHHSDADIEDVWRPYFAIATDLSRNKMLVMRTGPLWKAIRASSSIPGILPPVFTADGRMLVDGGVSDNVPLGAMKALKSGPNVVIDFAPSSTQLYDVDYDSLPGRWTLLGGLLNPFSGRDLPRVPGPAAVVQQSVFAHGRLADNAAEASDLVLRPPQLPGSSTMNWAIHAQVFEAAYRWTLDYLSRAEAEKNPVLAALAPGVSDLGAQRRTSAIAG